MVEEIDTKHLQKTAHPNLPPFSRYSSTKFRFFRKRPKWCPKIALYLENGYSYRKSDSIFGIHGKFPFLNVSSDFCLLVVFWVKIRPKDRQFSWVFWVVFGYFLGKYLKDFYKTRSEHRLNRYEADAKDRRWTLNEKFVKFYSKLAKIDQIGQMIQKKNWKKFFFCQSFKMVQFAKLTC